MLDVPEATIDQDVLERFPPPEHAEPGTRAQDKRGARASTTSQPSGST